MTNLQGFLLGLLQGVAEFLPISSSGHLALAQSLFGLEDLPLLFDLFLHLATLLAVCIFFREKIWSLLKCLGRWITHKQKKEIHLDKDNDILCNTEEQGHKTIIAIIISTVITGVIGIFVDKFLPSFSINFISACFIVTALLLILSHMMQKSDSYTKAVSNITNDKRVIKPTNAIIIGLMQGFSTIPGISRSGSTIAGAIFCNIDQKTAGDYSFLLSIPAILGAFVLELKDFSAMTQAISILPLIIGFITSFVVGYISLSLLMKIIRQGKLHWFSLYLIPLGIIGLIFF